MAFPTFESLQDARRAARIASGKGYSVQIVQAWSDAWLVDVYTGIIGGRGPVTGTIRTIGSLAAAEALPSRS